jgi:hypothetical protein
MRKPLSPGDSSSSAQLDYLGWKGFETGVVQRGSVDVFAV